MKLPSSRFRAHRGAQGGSRRRDDGRTHVYVHLSYGQGGTSWHERWKDGRLLGLNEPFPYGYQHAESDTLSIRFSEDSREGVMGKAWRYAVRLAFGFDLAHAWRNRHAIRSADAVWTHTESQGMAASWIIRLLPAAARPALLVQSVWLMDRWPRASALSKRRTRRLLGAADTLMFLSPLNAADAREVFPRQQVELVLFGISADEMHQPSTPRELSEHPVRVLSLGSDVHRDWETLIRAMDSFSADLRIATRDPRAARLAATVDNVEIVQPKSNSELVSQYEWADVVIIPLTENRHASGITVVEESTVMGKPVIVTGVGGLDAYFSEECVTYVPEKDLGALRRQIEAFAANPSFFLAKVPLGQQRMHDQVNSRFYVARHVQLTEEAFKRLPRPERPPLFRRRFG